jgi:hypothetical protein
MANNENNQLNKHKHKVPKIKEQGWLYYSLRMTTYLGKNNMELLQKPKPNVLSDLSQEDYIELEATLNPQGRETAATRNWRLARENAIKAWINADEVNFKTLVESCEDNPTAELICLNVSQSINPTAKALWDALVKRYNDNDGITTTHELTIFNTMTINSGETRGDWIDRLTKQIISLEGRDRKIDEKARVERLLTGLHPVPEFKAEAATIQLMAGNTWDSVTSILISYDKRDQEAGTKPNAAVANMAAGGNTTICHNCGEAGHKRPDCPNRINAPPSSRPGAKYAGGRKGGHGGRGSWTGGGSSGTAAGRGGNSKTRTKNVECNICGKRGHFASDCHNAKAFRQFLQSNKKRKSKKKHHNKHNTGSDSESSFMITEEASSEDSALITHMSTSAVLDSGCSSHTLDVRAVPDDIEIDSTHQTVIKTAKAGETLNAMGRANVGRLQDALVLTPGALSENLVSLSQLDNSGHITVLGNSEGLVYKGGQVTVTGGQLIARAPLNTDSNLYQVDNIQDLMTTADPSETAMLGSAPIKEDIQLWHRRLGHRSKRSIILYRNAGRIKGISAAVQLTARDQGICEACARTKSTRHRFKSKQPRRQMKKSKINDTKHSKRKRSDSEVDSGSESDDSKEENLAVSVNKIMTEMQPLNKVIPKISTDIKGPISVAGTGGQVYYQGFIEEGTTSFHTGYFSKNKSESLQHTDYHWNVRLKSEGSTVTTYQADGAPELISKDIIKLLAKCETRTIWSPAYTPELNSVIERNHRTVFESGHAMLVESNKPLMFWVEAIQYASIIYNCFPTNTKFGVMTPVEAKYGLVPDLGRFRIFGCFCYVHVPKEKRARGFIEKAYKAYFMGLDVKNQSFRAWIIDLNEMVTTAHLAFDEVTPMPKAMTEGTLQFADVSQNRKDFDFLVGQLYRDDEDNLFYVTTRVVVQRGLIVAFRGVYANGKVSKEEPNPIHAADVVKMVLEYQMSNQPVVIVDQRPVRLEVRDVSTEQSSSTVVDLPNIVAEEPRNGRRRPRDDQSLAPPVQVQEECKDTTVTPSAIDSLSARGARAAARDARTQICVGNPDEVMESVNLSYDSMQYTLHMEKFTAGPTEHCYSATPTEQEDPSFWLEADLDELNSLVLENRAWVAQTMPPDKRAIGMKWVRKVKTSGRRKSRLVGRGFNMIQGVDFNQCFAPVAKMATFRVFLSLIAIQKLFTGALDVKTAYLNSPIDEEVYMKPTPDMSRLLRILAKRTKSKADRKYIEQMISQIDDGDMLRLLKAIYGTKQGGRQWWITIDDFIIDLGFIPNPSDHCLYTLILAADYVILILYVDDIILAATTTALRDKYVSIFKQKWKVTYNGELEEFLNIQISRDQARAMVHMSQEKYIATFFDQYEFQADATVDTPMQENLKLPAEEESGVTQKQLDFVSNFPYQRIVGCILYVNICTMPTLSYAVSTLSQFNKNPTFLACKALIRCVKYIYNQRKAGLWLGGGRAIVGYFDSDWAGCINTRYSRSGSIHFFGNGPITWLSKMQSIVALSTMEAEHTAAVPAIQNNIWIRNLVKSTNIPSLNYVYATTLLGDNQAAIAIAENPMHHQKSKHIQLKFQYVMDQVKKNYVVMEYIQSKLNCADIFTKPVGKNIYKRHYHVCTGQGEVEPSIKKLRTIETESLECPRCSQLLPTSTTNP